MKGQCFWAWYFRCNIEGVKSLSVMLIVFWLQLQLPPIAGNSSGLTNWKYGNGRSCGACCLATRIVRSKGQLQSSRLERSICLHLCLMTVQKPVRLVVLFQRTDRIANNLMNCIVKRKTMHVTYTGNINCHSKQRLWVQTSKMQTYSNGCLKSVLIIAKKLIKAPHQLYIMPIMSKLFQHCKISKNMYYQ